jgi:SAM-dependent methyltransferase
MTEATFLPDTRAAYDAVAADYAARFDAELAAKPLDRALLAAFAELVHAADVGPVADLGCGPGHSTAQLQSLGLSVFGIDLSPGMVAVARGAHPGLRFDEGSMTSLDLPDGAAGGIVALYSTIHLPPESLPVAFSEFHRVLAPGGHALLAFQVGDERVHLERGREGAARLPAGAQAGAVAQCAAAGLMCTVAAVSRGMSCSRCASA